MGGTNQLQEAFAFLPPTCNVQGGHDGNIQTPFTDHICLG
jgi:hypothetical protein